MAVELLCGYVAKEFQHVLLENLGTLVLSCLLTVGNLTLSYIWLVSYV